MTTLGSVARGSFGVFIIATIACVTRDGGAGGVADAGLGGVAGAGLGGVAGAGLGGVAGAGLGGAGGTVFGEAGYGSENFPPPPPPPVCGDGQIRGRESCDDSNAVGGDGCSNECSVEPGWICSLEGGCISLYGDRACSPDACSDGATCIERGSRLGCACPSTLPAPCENLRFRALGLLANSDSCSPRGISGDGTTVVGVCSRYEVSVGIAREWAFRWSASAGTSELPFSSDHHSEAIAVSADGSTIVGNEHVELFADISAFRTSPEGVARLERGWVTNVSGDGRVVTGGFPIPVDAGGSSVVPALWTPSGVSPLATDGLDADILPLATSGDGSVVVGSAKVGSFLRAIRWDSSGVSVLPLPSGVVHSEAGALTTDGSIIVGAVSFPDDTQHVVRWTPSGIDDLGPGMASDVSADGSVIVGGKIWDAAHGWRRLEDILREAGTDLTGWSELAASGVSDDGKVVIGSSQYLAPGLSGSRAFLVWLP